MRSSLLALALAGCATATASTPAMRDEVFTIRMSGDVIALTHGGGVKVAPVPTGVQALGEPGVKDSLVVTTKLRDARGQVVGVATQQEHFPNGKGPGSQWDTWWSVMVPGRGSFFAYTTETVPPEHLPAFAQAGRGSEWTGSADGQVTNGPRPDRTGAILAGTGEWADARGTLAEHVRLTRLTPDGRLEGTMEVRLRATP